MHWTFFIVLILDKANPIFIIPAKVMPQLSSYKSHWKEKTQYDLQNTSESLRWMSEQKVEQICNKNIFAIHIVEFSFGFPLIFETTTENQNQNGFCITFHISNAICCFLFSTFIPYSFFIVGTFLRSPENVAQESCVMLNKCTC